MAEAGHAAELGLSRLDCLLEARGQYLAAEDLEQPGQLRPASAATWRGAATTLS